MTVLMTLAWLIIPTVHAEDPTPTAEPTAEETAAAEAAAAEAAEEAAEAAALAAAQQAAADARAVADEALARIAALEAAEAADDDDDDELMARFKAGKGLQISSPDGAWSLNTTTRAQVKLLLEETDDGGAGLGLQLRRARLGFTGNLGDPDIGYKIQLGFSPEDLGLQDGVITTTPVLDWHVDFTHIDSVKVRVGQYKVPFSREQIASSGTLNLVDRSLAHNEFGLDRDIGVMLHSQAPLGFDKVRYSVALMAGEGRNQRTVPDVGMLYVARVDVSPLGAFDDMDLTDLGRSESPLVALGAAVAYLDEAKKNEGIKGSTPADGGTTDTFNLTGDLVAKYMGFSAIGAVHYRQGTRNPGQETLDGEAFFVEDPRDGWGWVVQAGWVVRSEPAVDVAARFSQVRGLGETSLDDRQEVTVGINWYINESHLLKLSTDVAHTWGVAGVPAGETRAWSQLQFAY